MGWQACVRWNPSLRRIWLALGAYCVFKCLDVTGATIPFRQIRWVQAPILPHMDAQSPATMSVNLQGVIMVTSDFQWICCPWVRPSWSHLEIQPFSIIFPEVYCRGWLAYQKDLAEFISQEPEPAVEYKISQILCVWPSITSHSLQPTILFIAHCTPGKLLFLPPSCWWLPLSHPPFLTLQLFPSSWLLFSSTSTISTSYVALIPGKHILWESPYPQIITLLPPSLTSTVRMSTFSSKYEGMAE